MKYLKGDKVLLLNMSYFSNYFHYKNELIKEYTVLDADERYFSPYYENYDKHFSGCNLYSICKQEDGRALYGNDRFLHVIKDRDYILEKINETIITYDLKCEENDKKRIEFLENKIKRSQEEINEIKSGNGNWYSGFNTFNNLEYKNKVLSIIKKHINI